MGLCRIRIGIGMLGKYFFLIFGLGPGGELYDTVVVVVVMW